MQSVAAEMQHAETAFVKPSPDGDAEWELRWFTPTIEVDLCGHATLATTHALLSDGLVSGKVGFSTRSGVLTIPEDPVCGSAHTALAPYWAERLGRNELVGFQASARGGVVRVATVGDRVRLSGQAITTLDGELLV